MARGRERRRGFRGSRFYRGFERGVLSIGMGIVAFFLERRLLKAIRSGGVQRAPRTLAEREAFLEKEAGELREGSLSSSYPSSSEKPG